MAVSQEQTDRLVARIKPFGKQIGEEAKDGDRLAQEVIDCYSLFSKRPEPASFVLTEKALDAWLKRRDALVELFNI